MTMARSIGFGLAVGVLLDAFLIRMTFTPAVMALLGDKAWWLPAWLDRILPNLDVEGARLAERLARGSAVDTVGQDEVAGPREPATAR
jgi:RND superfamily putative drug exporter